MDIILPMVGFQPQISGAGSDHCTSTILTYCFAALRLHV